MLTPLETINAPWQSAPFRDTKLMAVDLDIQKRNDGSILLQSRVALKPYETNLAAALLRQCAEKNDKSAIAKRCPETGLWGFTSYAHLGHCVRAAAQWLLNNAPAGRAVMIAAGNGPNFAIINFAAWAAGLPVCPVSNAYFSVGGSYGRLNHVLTKVRPGIIFAEDGKACAAALAVLDLGDARIISVSSSQISKPSSDIADILDTKVTAAVDNAIAGSLPGDLAALMLTSGSTGLPKIVPISFENLAANSAQCQQTIGASAGFNDVMLDWLPWHHAAGAFNLRTTLLEGGTFYIDDGKPVPGLFDQTLRNLREIPVSYINNVPAGYAMLADALEQDHTIRKTVFSKLRLMLYGGAGLQQHVLDRLQMMAVIETGHRIIMTSGYGMTETVSAFMVIHFVTNKVGIGLPAPGVRIKLVPYDDRYEVRVIGPNVMTGYLDDPEKSAKAFDEEGFYCTGDLAVPHNPEHLAEGLGYAGRLAEEFKLANGNWVYGGQLRDSLLKALAPLITDLVLCDDNRPYLAVLAWPSPQATGIQPAERHAILTERLWQFNEAHPGSSASVRRLLLLGEPPSPHHHEISDKGTLNRRAVLDRRTTALERLYSDIPDGEIITA